MAEIHINVGIVALARGFITLETFANGMHSLAQGNAKSLRDLWVGPGRLDEAQLATVLDAIGPATGRDTMVFNAEPPKLDGAVDATRIGRGPVQLLQVPVGVATAPTAPSIVEMPGDPKRPMQAEVPPPASRPGEAIGARYKKRYALGAGGLGEVIACDDQVLGRTVAVKVGHQKGDVDAYSSKVILAREAKIISCLEHPNIIPIYDAGTDPARGPFYVMRQVSDMSLENILRRRRNAEGDAREYTLNRLLRYFLQVCNAVDYAHHRGIVHCDIKPANILLGEYGEVLLVDWGLAQSTTHPFGVRGGTLGYMAPEQMDAKCERLDERTDVFALGAVLYEILSGNSAFPEIKKSDITSLGQDPLRIYKRPAPPVSISTELTVSQEVEDICMRAIAIDRDQRTVTARQLADAIDELIEGSKQRERRRIEADKSADAGDELAERYHEFAESRPEKLTVFRALRADVVPWADLAEKQDLWDAEDIVRVTDALQVRTFHSAVSAYERALDSVPDHPRARRGLARLFWSELQRARHRGDALDQIAYEQLLREVDDGTFVRELQRDGILELAIGPTAGVVRLTKLSERDRRLVEGTAEVIAERPVAKRSLPAGRYIVKAVIAGGTDEVAWPVNVEPGWQCRIEVSPPAKPLGANEVFIPPGPARLGGDPLSAESDEAMIIDVPAFILQRHPVTFEEWFEFLDALRTEDPSQVTAHIPRTTLGMPTWNLSGETWIPDASLPAILLPPDPERLPVFGVSAESAEAYARWLANKTGLAWRLPTEIEWEKAGRGTDGRVYPWGEHFDATFCKMRDSRPGLPLAEPNGSFPWDVSPYGICDLAGGVADWCTPDHRRTAPREPREVVSRGGAWCDWPIDCRLASRRRYLATEHSARVGVRLARDP